MTLDVGSFLESGAICGIGNNRFLLGFGAHTWNRTAPEKSQHATFYFPNFFLDHPSPWLNFAHTLEIEADALLDLLSATPCIKPDVRWNKPKKIEFQKTFEDLQIRFANRKLVKAVPFMFEESSIKLSSSNLVYCLISALKYSKKYPAFVYGFWNETDQHGMLGATPELLFSLDHQAKMLHSMACAGTAPTDAMEALSHSEKDCREHQLVIDGIKQSLNPFGEINIGQQTVVNVGSIAHLVTPITMNMRGNCAFESIVHALHPTPSLGAYPKIQGDAWLLNYQTRIDRGRFGAPVGLLDSSYSQCLVAIRNMQWNHKQLKIGAGCGVIAESVMEDEWQEIQNKIQSIKGILGL